MLSILQSSFPPDLFRFLAVSLAMTWKMPIFSINHVLITFGSASTNLLKARISYIRHSQLSKFESKMKFNT